MSSLRSNKEALTEEVKSSIAMSLQLGEKAVSFSYDTPLLGDLPELDSMAVVSVITGLEEHFGISIDDDELSADAFATVGTLVDLVAEKLSEGQ